MNPHEKAVIKTLCYADIFNYPLKKEEIHRFLIHYKPATLEEVNAALASLKLPTDGTFFSLPNRQHLINLRLKRERLTQIKLKKLQKHIRLLRFVSGVQAVFLTGTASMGNVTPDDDLDIMIVTRANSLWLTRLLVTFLLSALGVRRTPHATSARDKLCINLYLSEDALQVPLQKQDLYTAHEVVQAQPLIDKNGIHRQFLSANRWILNHLPNAMAPQAPDSTDFGRIGQKPPFFESLAYRLQKKYMQSKRTRELVTPTRAFFHPRPTGQKILKEYEKKLHRYLPDTMHS